jgi:hypothetical protein
MTYNLLCSSNIAVGLATLRNVFWAYPTCPPLLQHAQRLISFKTVPTGIRFGISTVSLPLVFQISHSRLHFARNDYDHKSSPQQAGS